MKCVILYNRRRSSSQPRAARPHLRRAAGGVVLRGQPLSCLQPALAARCCSCWPGDRRYLWRLLPSAISPHRLTHMFRPPAMTLCVLPRHDLPSHRQSALTLPADADTARLTLTPMLARSVNPVRWQVLVSQRERRRDRHTPQLNRLPPDSGERLGDRQPQYRRPAGRCWVLPEPQDDRGAVRARPEQRALLSCGR
jgi:hypothetical protein